MKLAVSGKGGVGKTTIAGGLINHYAGKGYKVIAIDADPDMNLSSAIGIEREEAKKIKPISTLKKLIRERTGVQEGTIGGFFKLNPKVDDLPDGFGIDKDGIKLLTLGVVEKGGAGCICPESALLKALVTHLLLSKDEVVIMDMEAGIEHLGRGTAKAVDALIIIVEPGQRSIQTAETVRKLGKEIGVEKIFVVFNKITSKEDEKYLMKNLKGFDIVGSIQLSENIRKADIKGFSAYSHDKLFVEKIGEIAGAIENKIET